MKIPSNVQIVDTDGFGRHEIRAVLDCNMAPVWKVVPLTAIAPSEGDRRVKRAAKGRRPKD